MKLLYLLLILLGQLANIIATNMDFEEEELWIEQKLDHFNESDSRTWKMRYLSSETFYKAGGPIIINVNGEWDVVAKSPMFGLFYEMLETFNAYGFQTEHRYYGRSRPVENLRIENLEYLSLKQALADLAHFIKYQKSTIPNLSQSKVILIGCSYAGSMVVYFRKDYPDLMDGGWASGAGLAYRLDYSDGFVSVGKTLRKQGGNVCYDRIELFAKSYLKHKKNQDAVYRELEAANLTRPFNFIDEIISTHVQHRNATTLQGICRNITAIKPNDFLGFGQLLYLLSSKTKDEGEKDDFEFADEHGQRQYFYQSCSEFGNFFSSSSQHQPFGNTKPFHSEIAECRKQFGSKYTIDYISGKVDEINEKYGGQEPQVDKIFFTKAEDDPWRWMGVIDECATIIPGIGHCHDLRSSSEQDSPALKAARRKGLDLLRHWINGDESTRLTLNKC